LFSALSSIGASLVALHLLRSDYPAASWNREASESDPLDIGETDNGASVIVDKGFPRYDGEAIWINRETSVDGIPPDLWEAKLGGYQVLAKWLKDRRGRSLGTRELYTFRQIAVSLTETARLAKRAETLVASAGGWPAVAI
jgi:hypothetical protein